MDTSQLISYVEGELKRGVTQEQIRDILIEHGWNKETVEAVLLEVNKSVTSERDKLQITVPNNKRKQLFILIAALVFIFLIGGIAFYYFSPLSPYRTNQNQEADISTSNQEQKLNDQETENTGQSQEVGAQQYRASESEKNKAKQAGEYVREILECHYKETGEYPQTFSSIVESCQTEDPEVEFPEIVEQTHYSGDLFNYVSFENGQTYEFEMPAAMGEGYIITNEGMEYVVIPQKVIEDKFIQSRDTQRQSDIDTLDRAISFRLLDLGDIPNLYCNGEAGCLGKSTDENAGSINGEGWIKIDFTQDDTLGYDQLPIDSINNDGYYYIYCSNGQEYEINAVFESETYQGKMENDSGDDETRYEVGSRLDLIGNIAACTDY